MVTLNMKPIMPDDPFLNFMADPPNWSDDPVAMSCASYRLWKTTGERYARIEQQKPVDEDRDMANALRAYYRERTQDILFRTLKSAKGQAVSDFRRKLHLISMDQLIITQAELGMLYRLPYFYHEDLAIDRVVARTKTSMSDVWTHWPERNVATLQPLERVFKSRKHSENWQYWFVGPSNQAYMLMLHRDNPLLNMFDAVFQQPTVRLEFLSYSRNLRYPEHNFYQIHQPTLANV